MTYDEDADELRLADEDHAERSTWWRRNRLPVTVLGLIGSIGALLIADQVRSVSERERERRLLNHDEREWIEMSDGLQASSGETVGATAHLTIKAGEENALVEVRNGDGTVFIVTSVGAGQTAVMRAPEGAWTVSLREGTAVKDSREMMREMAIYDEIARARVREKAASRLTPEQREF